MAGRRVPLGSRAFVLTVVGVVTALMVAIVVVLALNEPGTDTPSSGAEHAADSAEERKAGGGDGEGTGDGTGEGDGSGSAQATGTGVNGEGTDGAVGFTRFAYEASVNCRAANGDKAPLVLSWAGANAVAAYWRAGESDPTSADADNGHPVPVAGDQGDLVVGGEPRGVFQECGHREHYYVVITLVDRDGRTTSRTAAFRDTSWGGGGVEDDPAASARIRGFTAPATAGCLSAQAPAHQPVVEVTVSWEFDGANRAAIGVATSDALNAPYRDGLEPTGSMDVPFSCSNASQVYTLTIAGADGEHISRTVTVESGATP